MATVKTFKELIEGTDPVVLDGAFLCASTLRDGYTDTYSGKHWYKVEKTVTGEPEAQVTSYKVSPATYDKETDALVVTGDPIILTEGDLIFYIVGTNRDSYTFPVLKQEAVTETQELEKQVLQAFLAFIADRFRFGLQHLYLVDETSTYTP